MQERRLVMLDECIMLGCRIPFRLLSLFGSLPCTIHIITIHTVFGSETRLVVEVDPKVNKAKAVLSSREFGTVSFALPFRG